MMCSCSTGVMLSQKSRTWVKWSSKDTASARWEVSRTLVLSATRTARCSKDPSTSALAWNGQPPSRELGL